MVTIRFRPEVFAFGVPAHAYNFEKLALTAHEHLVSFICTLLCRTLGVDAALNVFIDSELQSFLDNNAGRRKRRLLLILAALGTQFKNAAFCELYDGCLVETSKTCGRLLEDLASMLPGTDWDSEGGVKKLSGVTVEYALASKKRTQKFVFCRGKGGRLQGASCSAATEQPASD